MVEKLILDNQKCVREKIIECIGELISPLDKEELSSKLFNFYTNTIDEFYYNKNIVPIKKQKKNTKKKKKIQKKMKNWKTSIIILLTISQQYYFVMEKKFGLN